MSRFIHEIFLLQTNQGFVRIYSNSMLATTAFY